MYIKNVQISPTPCNIYANAVNSWNNRIIMRTFLTWPFDDYVVKQRRILAARDCKSLLWTNPTAFFNSGRKPHYITPIWYCIILFSYIIIQKIISINEKLCFMIQKQKIIFLSHFHLFWMFFCTKRWNAPRSNNTINHLAIIHPVIYFVIYTQFFLKIWGFVM